MPHDGLSSKRGSIFDPTSGTLFREDVVQEDSQVAILPFLVE